MNDLIQYAQTIISFLEENGANLNQVSQQALGELLQNILQIIESGQQEQSPVEGLQPQLQSGPMESSNINSFGYDEKNGRLMVKFQGDYPQENGPVYAYDGVPKNIFELFRQGAVPARTDGKNAWGEWWKGKVPSLGASMFTLIKNGGYPYRRVSG